MIPPASLHEVATEMNSNERRPGRWTLEVVAVAAVGLCVAALGVSGDLRHPLNCDEIFTYYGSMASGPAELYEVLTRGGFDSSPPLYDVAVWQALRIVSDPHLAVRLPATIGFAVMCVCLYAYARRRVPAAYAAVAMLAPAAGGFGYATNGRPYGLALGLAGLALVAWQAAAEGRRRRPALVALAASLAAGVATHYYAVLLLVPLGLAELTRTFEAREGRPDVPVWVALACAFAPLPWLLPMMAHSRGLAQGASWLKVEPLALIATYSHVLTSLLYPLAALAVLLLLRPWIVRPRPGPAGEAGPGSPTYPLSDVALILGLMAMPIVAYGLGVVVTKAYVSRYAAAFIAGPALLLAYLGARLFRGQALVGLILAGATLYCLKGLARDALRPPPGRPRFGEVGAASARAAGANRRLLIPWGNDYIQYCFYLRPEDAGRLTLVDFDDATHAEIFRGLGRWVARKGLARYDIRERGDYFDHLDDYYLYGKIDRVIEGGSRRPLKFEPLAPPGAARLADPGLYAIEPAVGGPR